MSLNIRWMDPQNELTVCKCINVDFKTANITKAVKYHWLIRIVCNKFDMVRLCFYLVIDQ